MRVEQNVSVQSGPSGKAKSRPLRRHLASGRANSTLLLSLSLISSSHVVFFFFFSCRKHHAFLHASSNPQMNAQ